MLHFLIVWAARVRKTFEPIFRRSLPNFLSKKLRIFWSSGLRDPGKLLSCFLTNIAQLFVRKIMQFLIVWAARVRKTFELFLDEPCTTFCPKSCANFWSSGRRDPGKLLSWFSSDFCSVTLIGDFDFQTQKSRPLSEKKVDDISPVPFSATLSHFRRFWALQKTFNRLFTLLTRRLLRAKNSNGVGRVFWTSMTFPRTPSESFCPFSRHRSRWVSVKKFDDFWFWWGCGGTTFRESNPFSEVSTTFQINLPRPLCLRKMTEKRSIIFT